MVNSSAFVLLMLSLSVLTLTNFLPLCDTDAKITRHNQGKFYSIIKASGNRELRREIRRANYPSGIKRNYKRKESTKLEGNQDTSVAQTKKKRYNEEI